MPLDPTAIQYRNKYFYGWNIVAATMLFQCFARGLIIYCYGALAVFLEAEFNTTRTGVSLGMTCLLLVNGLCAPLVGPLTDRIGLRSTFILGACCLSGGLWLISVSQSIGPVILIYGTLLSTANILLGHITANTLIVHWFQWMRGRALGLASSGIALGGLIMPPLLVTSINALDWRTSLQVFAGIAIILIPLVARFVVYEHPRELALNPDGSDKDATDSASAEHKKQPKQNTFDLLRNRKFWLLTLVICSVPASQTAIHAHLIPLAVDRNISITGAAYMVSLLSILSISGRLLFGYLADRVPLLLLLRISVMIMATGITAWIFGDNLLLLLAASTIMGFAQGSQQPVWSATVGSTFGIKNFSRVMGTMALVQMPLVMGAPLMMGSLFDLTGGYTTPLMIILGALCTSLLLSTTLKIEQTK